MDIVEHQVLWNLDQLFGWVEALLTVGAERRKASADPLADGEVGDTGTDLLDHTCSFKADHNRRLADDQRVRNASSVVSIQEVHPDGRIAQSHLTWTRLPNLNLLPYEVVRPTFFMNYLCHCHD
jgi:hypothetical protein